MTLHAHAYRDMRRIKPNDNPSGLGVYSGPGPDAKQVGLASPRGYVGGWRDYSDLRGDYPPPEVTWRLVLDREMVDGRAVPLEKKQDLGDRWVLRRGVFVELGEDAE